jgi:hypothetical protein
MTWTLWPSLRRCYSGRRRKTSCLGDLDNGRLKGRAWAGGDCFSKGKWARFRGPAIDMAIAASRGLEVDRRRPPRLNERPADAWPGAQGGGGSGLSLEFG